MPRKTIASLAVAAAALLAPQAASAADLYVGPNDGDADCTQDLPCTLWSAIDRADRLAGRDTIHLSGAISQDVSVDLTRSPIDLVGSAGARIDFADGTALLIGSDSSARWLHVRAQRRGVIIEHGGQLRDATVDALAQDSRAVTVSGGAAPTRPTDITRVGINAPGGLGVDVEPTDDAQRVQIVDSDIRAGRGIQDYAASACRGFALHSSTVVASDGTVAVGAYCEDEIANSVIRQTRAEGNGVQAASGTLSISHSTIAGPSSGDLYYRPRGVFANAGADVDLSESIVTGFLTDVSADAGYFDTYRNIDVPSAAINVTRSSFASAAGDGVRSSDPAPGGDPRFADAAAGDYRLSDQSPLIDAGHETQQGSAQTDRAGADRFADGNGDGKAERDIGAYERPAVERRTPPAEPTGPADPTRPADPAGPADPEPQSRRADPEPQGMPADETRPQDMRVAPAPPRFAFAGTTLTVSRQRRVALPVSCISSSGGCSLAVVITAKVGGHSITLGRAGAARFKLTRRAVALLERSRIRRVTVALTATDPAGGAATATRSYRLRLR
jgi:hypothetical protein